MEGPIARGTIRTSFVLGLRLLVQAATLLLVARMLGPHQFGAFAGVAALAVILGTLSTFGTHLVLLGEVSKDPARRADVLPWAIPTTLLCSSMLLGIYLLVCALAFSNAGIVIEVLLSIGVAELWLQPLLRLAAAEHLALGRPARSQALVAVPLVLRAVAAATVFVLQPANPLTAYGYGYVIASLFALAIGIHTIPTRWPALKSWRLPHKAELRNAGSYAALALSSTSPAELDKALAAKLLTLTSAGLYAAGARVIGAATLPVIAMMLSALPRLFRHGREPDTRMLRWIFGVALGYSVLLAVLLWFISPAFAWLLGAKYQSIDHVIRLLTPAVSGMALRLAAGNVLLALGRPWLRVTFEATGAAVLLATATALAGPLGVFGMSLALTSSEWSMAVLGWTIILWHRTSHRPIQEVT